MLSRREGSERFAKYTPYVSGNEAIPAAHHEIICDTLQDVIEGREKRVIICAPPGSAKSTYSSLYFPSFALGRFPKWKVIGCAHTQTLAEDWSKKVRNTIDGNQFYHNLFPDTQIASDTRASERWATTQGGGYLASGVGGGIAGFRANILLIDDPYKNREDANSPVIRQKVVDWFYTDARPRLLPTGAVILIQTRWHPEDLAGVLIDRSENGTGDKYKIISLQAVYEDGPDPLHRKVGQALWPQWQDIDNLLAIKKDMKPLDWLALYQQKPMNPEGNVIQTSWFQRYETIPKDILQRLIIVASWDTAGVVKEKTDYSVGLLAGIDPWNGNVYLMDMYRKQSEYPELEKDVYAWSNGGNMKALRAHQVLIEDRGTGTSLLQRYRNMNINCIAVSPWALGTKEFRFDQASPKIEAGKIFIPKDGQYNWVSQFLAEILQFPFGKYKDVCDAFSQLVNYWEAKSQRRGSIKMGTYA